MPSSSRLSCLALLALVPPAFAMAACDRGEALDTVVDVSADPSVWRDDAARILGALPKVVTSFKPSEAATAFNTSYSTGPVFGAACTYGDGPRQLVVRVESGNVRERAATVLHGKANPGEAFVSHDVTVHGQKGVVHWNGVGKTADVAYVLQHRFVVSLRLVPAASDDEAVQLAEAMDVGPIQALTLTGVK